MLTSKKFLHRALKAARLSNELYPIINEQLVDNTAGEMGDVILHFVLSEIVGEDWNKWHRKVGNHRVKSGYFLVDELFDAVYYHGDLKGAQRLARAGRKVINGKS